MHSSSSADPATRSQSRCATVRLQGCAPTRAAQAESALALPSAEACSRRHGTCAGVSSRCRGPSADWLAEASQAARRPSSSTGRVEAPALHRRRPSAAARCSGRSSAAGASFAVCCSVPVVDDACACTVCLWRADCTRRSRRGRCADLSFASSWAVRPRRRVTRAEPSAVGRRDRPSARLRGELHRARARDSLSRLGRRRGPRRRTTGGPSCRALRGVVPLIDDGDRGRLLCSVATSGYGTVRVRHAPALAYLKV